MVSASLLQVAASGVVLIACVMPDPNHGGMTALQHSLVQGVDINTTLGAYALACAAVSLFLSLLVIIMNWRCSNALSKSCCVLPKFGATTVGSLIALFFFVWWGVGTCILTFQGPFLLTSNGYFAAWGALGAAIAQVGEAQGLDVQNAKSQVGSTDPSKAKLLAMLVCGAVLFFACMGDDRSRLEQSEGVFALAVAIATIALSILLLPCGASAPSVLRKLIGLLVALAWIGEAVVCTFRAPFTVTGNGYFASWFGVVAALLYLAEQ